MTPDQKQNLNVATVRTTVQTVVLTAVVAVIAKLTDWQVEVDDLLPYVPLLAPVTAVFYRASRWLTARYPSLGWVLFGSGKEPEYK